MHAARKRWTEVEGSAEDSRWTPRRYRSSESEYPRDEGVIGNWPVADLTAHALLEILSNVEVRGSCSSHCRAFLLGPATFGRLRRRSSNSKRLFGSFRRRKTKMRRPHKVSLAEQVLAMLSELWRLQAPKVNNVKRS